MGPLARRRPSALVGTLHAAARGRFCSWRLEQFGESHNGWSVSSCTGRVGCGGRAYANGSARWQKRASNRAVGGATGQGLCVPDFARAAQGLARYGAPCRCSRAVGWGGLRGSKTGRGAEHTGGAATRGRGSNATTGARGAARGEGGGFRHGAPARLPRGGELPTGAGAPRQGEKGLHKGARRPRASAGVEAGGLGPAPPRRAGPRWGPGRPSSC